MGVEHEYNADPFGDGECECDGCYDGESCDYPDRSAVSESRVTALFPNSGWRLKGEHTGCEITSRPTTDLAELVDTFTAVERLIGSAGHRDCGLHVHLNCTPSMGPAMNPFRFFRLWQRHKDEFLYPFVPGVGVDDRHRGEWSAKTEAPSIRRWLGAGRYTEINPSALNAHGTVEVRLGGATDDMAAFEDWLRRLATLAGLAAYRPDETPRTASVRYVYSSLVRHWLQAKAGVPIAEITTMQAEMVDLRDRLGVSY